MLKNDLINKFRKSTSGNKEIAGKRILNEGLISSFNVEKDNNEIIINSSVISENYFSEYSTKLKIDITSKDIISTHCTCQDYANYELKRKNYCCKHLHAIFYNFLTNLENYDDIYKSLEETYYYEKSNDSIFKVNSNNSILSLLLEEENKEEIKIEVYINKKGYKNYLCAEFKIGLKGLASNKLYVIKDINQLLISYTNKLPIRYGKDFTFNLRTQRLGVKEDKIIKFIQKIKEIENLSSRFIKRQDSFIDGKNIIIPEFLIREFFETISKNRVYLNEGFFYRAVEAEILFDKPNTSFYLKELNSRYLLSIEDGFPVALNKEKTVYIYGSSIYLPESKYCYEILKFINAFNGKEQLTLDRKDEVKILSSLLPKLYNLSQEVKISNSIKEKIVREDVKFSFYFDKVNSTTVLTVKVKYGAHEFNIFHDYKDKIIYRDLNKESEITSLLRGYGFEASGDKFYLILGDDYIFNFFKNDIAKLQELGEVYYSENFKGIRNISTKSISAEISAGKYDYFDFKFNIDNIPKSEVYEILTAFKDNLKYYKLKDGEYLDLDEIELKSFLKLLDAISIGNDLNKDSLLVNKNKAVYLESIIKDNKLRYIKGKNELSKISKKFKEIKKLAFKEPLSLVAELRSYQKEGYNWLKTLDYLGFGGILGDEMGLGKTIQAITFILSSLPSKTLIVAPTSLIYNWGNEIKKFAPTIKFVVVNGIKEERVKVLNEYHNFDVIITTYNLLKRDLDIYKEINFDYCFIDEAQNIKNSSSQNSISVKDINANRKFALTGTPIENSLMDLWSIFDFIMPGYLFEEKDFSVRYHKKLKESKEVLEELNKLISPFILRRYKKDVIKELPLKIEKKLVVSMSKEQEKAYGIYSDYVKKLIEKKVMEDDLKNSKIEILSYITKLRQLSLDPSVVLNDYSGDSGKIDALIEILKQGIDEGHKILVFSQFTSVLKNIANKMKGEEISFNYLDGSVPSKNRIELIDDFNNGNKSVFLISLKAGGTGLNLTSADIVIHFDPWWNPAVEDQATDRAHRLGQKNVVEVIKLISKDTIEEKIVELQEEKRKLIANILDNEGEAININSLTDEDIINLFSK